MFNVEENWYKGWLFKLEFISPLNEIKSVMESASNIRDQIENRKQWNQWLFENIKLAKKKERKKTEDKWRSLD